MSDRAARRLARQGQGKMYCLAGVGGRVPDILENTRQAETILAIDGCSQECAANTLRQAGINKFTHLRLAGLGMEKGSAPASGANIARVVNKAAEMLSQQHKTQIPK